MTRVKGICYKVADVSLGPTHTAVLTESGHVVTFGRNAEGQLGRGHLRSSSSGPCMVKSMANRVATVSSTLKCMPSGFVTSKREHTQWLKSIPVPLLTA
jgi:Alpha-tubulin suppressor and related RCC1 domain-containing proteins